MARIEELASRGKRFHREAGCPQQPLQCPADGSIVIDDDDRWCGLGHGGLDSP
jgi:hypothetical protein